MTFLRLAFMGTPGFAVPALRALVAAGHEVAMVYTQQPRPAGRGQAVKPSPVQLEAERLGLPVRAPTKLRDVADEHVRFAALSLDAAVVAAYGLILPKAMLRAPARGCLNIHGSLLPRWRGAAPIQSAILAGDRDTGITIMQMEEGLDTGPMLRREAMQIGSLDAAAVHDALGAMGARLIVEELAQPSDPVAQDGASATYAARLSRVDARLDWQHEAATLERRIRAMFPWPGASAALDGTTFKILSGTVVADEVPAATPPGTVLDQRLSIACGRGVLRIDRLQWPGRTALDAVTFLRGRPIPAGTRLR